MGNTEWEHMRRNGEQSGSDDNITLDAKNVAMIEKDIVQQYLALV